MADGRRLRRPWIVVVDSADLLRFRDFRAPGRAVTGASSASDGSFHDFRHRDLFAIISRFETVQT
jgi:hypothetical protein